MGSFHRTGARVALAALLAGPFAAGSAAENVSEIGLEGTRLTPVGAIRAGNEAGTIPEWTGGLAQPPAAVSYTHLTLPTIYSV